MFIVVNTNDVELCTFWKQIFTLGQFKDLQCKVQRFPVRPCLTTFRAPPRQHHLIEPNLATLIHHSPSSPQFTLGPHSWCCTFQALGTFIMTYTHHYGLTKYFHCCKKTLCALSPLSPFLQPLKLCIAPIVFGPFSKASYNWNHATGEPFQICFFHLVICFLNSSMSFHSLMAHFFLARITFQCLNVRQFNLFIHLLKDLATQVLVILNTPT